MGLTNIKPMIPFCRTPEEGRRVIQVMNEYGLNKGKTAWKSMLCAKSLKRHRRRSIFQKSFDGFSIGSNDLTQLTLGLDRDFQILVAHIFDERNDAVKRTGFTSYKQLQHNHHPRRKVGICGQAPSDFPEFAEFLVECGIGQYLTESRYCYKKQIKNC